MDSLRPWKGQYDFWFFRLQCHWPDQGCPVAGKSTAKHTRYVDQRAAPTDHTSIVWTVADHVAFSTQDGVLQGNRV
jgi:hypothetical protein